MRRFFLCALTGLAGCLLFSTAAQARKWTAADFPLRVHLFKHSSHSHYSHHYLDGVDGEGRANLYGNGEPRGFDYSYHCANRLLNSVGYQTYMARWKKPGKTLVLVLPAMGDTCELNVDVKESAYYKKDGEVQEEPAAKFKEWMVKHQYDPEHGMNEPVNVEQQAAGSGADAQQ
jgi:hypothetical protein